MNEKIEAQALMFANRLRKKFDHLKKWARRKNIGAFRLYDRDIPEIPLVLDYYVDIKGDAALSGALYKRPYEKDKEDEDTWLYAMRDAAAGALGIDPALVFLRQRQKQKGASQYEKIEEKNFTKIVNEGDLAFKVNLSDYLDTGLFLDRRLTRSIVGGMSAGKRILNLFAYTGSFSARAAYGGALSTDSVDLSNTYLAWAMENFSLNKMSAVFMGYRDFFDAQHLKESRSRGGSARVVNPRGANNLIRADALDFIAKAAVSGTRWDIIVLDPPAFSNSKKMAGIFDLRRDLIKTLDQCLKLLSPGGKILFSAAARRLGTSAAELEAELKARVTDLEDTTRDEDFKGKKIPKCFLIEKTPAPSVSLQSPR